MNLKVVPGASLPDLDLWVNHFRSLLFYLKPILWETTAREFPSQLLLLLLEKTVFAFVQTNDVAITQNGLCPTS